MIHDKENRLFILTKPEGEAHIEYKLEDGTLTVLHTVVPEALKGKGLGAELAAAAAAYAKENGFKLASECSYMSAWMKKRNA